MTYREIHRHLIAATEGRQCLSYREVKGVLRGLGYGNPIASAHAISTLAAEGALKVFAGGAVLIYAEPPK